MSYIPNRKRISYVAQQITSDKSIRRLSPKGSFILLTFSVHHSYFGIECIESSLTISFSLAEFCNVNIVFGEALVNTTSALYHLQWTAVEPRKQNKSRLIAAHTSSSSHFALYGFLLPLQIHPYTCLHAFRLPEYTSYQSQVPRLLLRCTVCRCTSSPGKRTEYKGINISVWHTQTSRSCSSELIYKYETLPHTESNTLILQNKYINIHTLAGARWFIQRLASHPLANTFLTEQQPHN